MGNLCGNLNFDDIFNFSIILYSKNYLNALSSIFIKYLIENEIEEKNILKTIYILEKTNSFETEINLFYDKFLIKHLIKHIKYINKNYLEFKNLEKNINSE